MADVEIGEVSTRIEVTDRAGDTSVNVQRMVEAVLQRLREDQAHADMRQRDDRLRDRSWLSDVKSD